MTSRKDKISQYVDTTGQMSSRELVFGTWYLKNKILFQEIGMGILIAFCVVTMGFSLFKWGEYLFFGYWADQEYLVRHAEISPDYASTQTSYKAQDLRISDVRVFGTSDDMYDLAVNIENPNARWIAYVTYHFRYSGVETEVQTAPVMPMAKRPVAAFGEESAAFPAGVNFIIDDIKWKSVDAHKIPDVGYYLSERNLFAIDNFVIDPPSLTGISVPSITLDLLNQSAFNYREPVFLVELTNGSQVVGYIYLYFDQLPAFSSQNVELRYFNQTTQFNNARIIPLIDFFDDSVYIDPGDI